MSHDPLDPDPDPDPELEELEELDALRSEIAALSGWPLDKRETFAAFALMGLASRLQPLQTNSTDAQKIVVDLAFKLGDMSLAASEKE